jgi:predicted Zn-dependent peptidase
MMEEIEKLKNELVSAEELQGVKNRARSELIQLLSSNMSMAMQLASYQVLTGDWRNLFRYLEDLNKVTPEAIQRVAKATFTDKNRTVGVIEPAQAASAR